MLRKYQNSSSVNDKLSIKILSARYGLIDANFLIPLYDQKMTLERAVELRPLVKKKVDEIVDTFYPKEVFISVSNLYEQALIGLDRLFAQETTVTISRGMPGKKLAEIYTWLYGQPAKQPYNRSAKAMIRGVEIQMSVSEIIVTGRHHLAKDRKGADRFQSWCVYIDETPVSAKWLVSKITGIPVAKFGGFEARRVLEQLGIEVKAT